MGGHAQMRTEEQTAADIGHRHRERRADRVDHRGEAKRDKPFLIQIYIYLDVYYFKTLIKIDMAGTVIVQDNIFTIL